MARLPTPGADNGNWGDILNDYLSQAHKSDGTIKDNSITNAQIASDAVNATSIADGSITNAQIADGTIAETKLASAVQAKLNATAGAPDWSSITNKPPVIAAGADQAAARAAIGAGISNLTLGSSSTTAAAGDDPRLSNTRTPTDGTVTTAKFTTSTLVTESEGLASSDNDTSIPTTAAVVDALSNRLTVVNYSGDLNATRPSAPAVYWAGFPSTPTNAQTQDIVEADSRRSLGDFMHPYVAGAIYPPSDVTSYVTDNVIPAYTNRYSIAFNNADASLRWRFSGKWYDFSSNGLNSINGATPNDPASWTSFEVEFYLSGDQFALWSVTSGTPSDYRIFVDDMPLTPDWELNSSTPYDTNYMKVQFATSRIRRIRIMMSGLATFTGLFLPGSSDVWAAPKRFRAAIIGDSYIQGGHNAGPGQAYLQAAGLPNQLAIITGWEVMNMGQGSTGYTANGSNAGGKDFYGSSSRMAALAALPALDLIIVYGSGNDSSASGSTLTTAANNLWNAIKAARPTTPIVVAGMEPGTINGFNDTLLNSSNAVLKAAAAANSNVAGFIDMRDPSDPWMVGTGNAGAPNKSGNADFFISPDTVHPTRAGYYNMAYKMVEALRKIRV